MPNFPRSLPDLAERDGRDEEAKQAKMSTSANPVRKEAVAHHKEAVAHPISSATTFGNILSGNGPLPVADPHQVQVPVGTTAGSPLLAVVSASAAANFIEAPRVPQIFGPSPDLESGKSGASTTCAAIEDGSGTRMGAATVSAVSGRWRSGTSAANHAPGSAAVVAGPNAYRV